MCGCCIQHWGLHHALLGAQSEMISAEPCLYAGMVGLAIMMASKWKRPSATNRIASTCCFSTGAVHPNTSPACMLHFCLLGQACQVFTCWPLMLITFFATHSTLKCIMGTEHVADALHHHEHGICVEILIAPGDKGRLWGTAKLGNSGESCSRTVWREAANWMVPARASFCSGLKFNLQHQFATVTLLLAIATRF